MGGSCSEGYKSTTAGESRSGDTGTTVGLAVVKGTQVLQEEVRSKKLFH